MSANALFLTNVICPLLGGIPLLCFAFYFFYAGQGLFRPRARLFPAFLLAFSLYVLGRPVQLLLGPYPWPMIVNCLRTFLFVGICGPLVLHEARCLCRATPRRHTRLWPLLALGGALAALYTIVLALALSPAETPLVFELGALKAYENAPSHLTPPLFAREVTILIQAIAGAGFFGLAGYEALKERRALAEKPTGSRHLFYFGVGCLIFGGAVLLGTLTRQWWFYYLASVPSAFFIGMGVREDMLYVSRRVERVTPFLRDELFHALGSGPRQEAKVQDLKDLLGKQVTPTVVLAVSSDDSGGTAEARLTIQESTRKRLMTLLDGEIGEAGYLLLPMGTGRFAVCLDLAEDRAGALAETLRSRLRAEGDGHGVVVGIGRTHPPEELHHSYLEAQTALRAAEESGQPIVCYVDLGAIPSQRRFPLELRDAFLLELKHVRHAAARRRLQVLLDQVAIHAEGDAVIYRVRLQGLLGTILERLDRDGGAPPALLTDIAAAFQELSRLESMDDLAHAFTTALDKLLRRVEPPQVESTSGNSLLRAKAYVDENLAEDLKLADVAKRAGVSRAQLQRIFSQTLGMSYSAYLTTARMQKAKALLAGTDRPITDIAFDVGYNDSNYFSTAFRKHEGITPRQYRKQG